MSDVQMSDDDADSLLSHTPPKKAQTAPAAKKGGGSKPLADVENESFRDGAADNKNASDKYQKVSDHDNRA